MSSPKKETLSLAYRFGVMTRNPFSSNGPPGQARR